MCVSVCIFGWILIRARNYRIFNYISRHRSRAAFAFSIRANTTSSNSSFSAVTRCFHECQSCGIARKQYSSEFFAHFASVRQDEPRGWSVQFKWHQRSLSRCVSRKWAVSNPRIQWASQWTCVQRSRGNITLLPSHSRMPFDSFTVTVIMETHEISLSNRRYRRTMLSAHHGDKGRFNYLYGGPPISLFLPIPPRFVRLADTFVHRDPVYFLNWLDYCPDWISRKSVRRDQVSLLYWLDVKISWLREWSIKSRRPATYYNEMPELIKCSRNSDRCTLQFNAPPLARSVPLIPHHLFRWQIFLMGSIGILREFN